MNKAKWGINTELLSISLATLIFLGAIAQAEVSLQCNFYNSEDEVSMSLEGSNLGFGAQVILEPDFLSYDNGGSSNDEDSHYSYNLNFNGKSMSSGAETNNGGFGWSAIANSNVDGEDSKALSLTSHSQVADGYLNTYSSNPYLNVERSIAVNNGYYSETSTIDADILDSKGSGTIINQKKGTVNIGDDSKGSTDSAVDEKWPAYFADYKKISYLGPGITARDYYDNNGDVVSNSIRSWKLSKQSYYRGYLNRTLIDVHIAPGSAIEKRYRNSSSRYSLLQDSVGEKTHLGIVRQRMYTNETKFGRPEVYPTVSQDYVGQQKIALSIDIANFVDRVNVDDAWLDCCFGGYLSMPGSYRSGDSGFGSNLTRIFDCTCYQPTA